MIQLEVAIRRVGSGSGSYRTGRVSLTFWKKSGRVNLYVVFFHIFERFWLDYRSFDLGSGRIWIRSDQFNFLKKTDRIGFESERIEQVSRVGSDLPPLDSIYNGILSISYQHFFLIHMFFIKRWDLKVQVLIFWRVSNLYDFIVQFIWYIDLLFSLNITNWNNNSFNFFPQKNNLLNKRILTWIIN
jgi:hypothetical protein